MDKEINKEYQPLIAYLTEIMQKLQNQSDVLRGKDIKICLRDDKEYTDNACVTATAGIIGFGKKYLQKQAAKGEDYVARTIAHELSHIVYKAKHKINGHGYNKEDEVFADNYGLILCHRAGYNINLPIWQKKLEKADQNADEHPAEKIRQLLINKTAAYLTDENSPRTIKPFREPIPDTPLTEVFSDLVKANNLTLTSDALHNVQTDIQTMRDYNLILEEDKPRFAKRTGSQHRLQEIMQSDDFASKTKDIYLVDFHKIEDEEFLALYGKIMENEIIDDKVLQLKVRDYFAELCNVNIDNSETKKYLLPSLDEVALETLEEVCSNKEADDFRKDYVLANQQHRDLTGGVSDQILLMDHLVAEKRFHHPHHRQRLYDLFAKTLLRDIGKNRDSDLYRKCLTQILEKLDGKIHNADVIPLVKTLRDTLGIEGQNLIILQKFAKDNNIEINQIRTEMLMTKCLLDSDLAQKTVSYLMSAGRKPPVEDFEAAMRDIYKDWKNIDPSKRADYFALLMENVAPNATPAQKLEQFIDKKDHLKDGVNCHDSIYKPLVEMYISTYKPEQQPYVVTTLLSRKQPGAHYSYEDYFKEILNSSGIKGLRALNQIYDTKLPEEILKIETNMSPLKAQDGIIFDNLRKLGALAQKSENSLEIRKIGRHLMIATSSAKMPQFRTRNI